ncbi:hypothetical protein ACFRFQ_08525 [Rhodococcus sp. NPDC056743]|uniref:hypothetical protein n=1 Tax=Rhodococcus sp. NPDC056743 TaxID=3345934 RepID=UPI003671B359
MSPRLGWIGDPSPDSATWLAPYPYPYPDAEPRSRWMADRYPHVLRILHPAYLDYDGKPRAVTWAQIAAAVGTEITVGTHFSEIVGAWFPESTRPPDPTATIDGIFDSSPEMGSLPTELVDIVYEHFDDAHGGLFWAGWGPHSPPPGCTLRTSGGPRIKPRALQPGSTTWTRLSCPPTSPASNPSMRIQHSRHSCTHTDKTRTIASANHCGAQ